MYNGIGLPTPRGSGTNGFVQRNLAFVGKRRQQKVDTVSQPDSEINRPPNFEILTHEKKRKIESNCLRLQKELEDEGWEEKQIKRTVDDYRQRKLDDLSKMTEKEHGDRIKRSFGISSDYIDGTAVTQMKRPVDVKKEVKQEEAVIKSDIKVEVKEEPSASANLDKKPLLPHIKKENTDEIEGKRKREPSESERKRHRQRSASQSSTSSSSSSSSFTSSTTSSPSSSGSSCSRSSSSGSSSSSSSSSTWSTASSASTTPRNRYRSDKREHSLPKRYSSSRRSNPRHRSNHSPSTTPSSISSRSRSSRSSYSRSSRSRHSRRSPVSNGRRASSYHSHHRRKR